MPEQNPTAMESGDIIGDSCSSCGKEWAEHLGIQSLCAETRELRVRAEQASEESGKARSKLKATEAELSEARQAILKSVMVVDGLNANVERLKRNLADA